MDINADAIAILKNQLELLKQDLISLTNDGRIYPTFSVRQTQIDNLNYSIKVLEMNSCHRDAIDNQ